MAVTTIGGSSGSGLQQYEQVFTTSGTWTKPNGVKTVELTVVGAGGSGCVGFTSTVGGGGGVFKGIVDVSTAGTVPITIGAGGQMGANTQAAATGGSTFFGNYVAATGGVGAPPTAYYAGSSGTWYYPNQPGNASIVVNSSAGSASNFTANDIQYTSQGVVKFNGSYYVMATADGATIRRSTDGLTWTNVKTTAGLSSTTSMQLAYGNGVWVLVGAANIYYTSTDGTNWTSRTVPNSWTSTKAVSFANGRFYMASASTTMSSSGLVYSTDGVNWTNTSVTVSYTWHAGKVAYGNGVYVCVPCQEGSSAGTVAYSSDGITWAESLTSQVWTSSGAWPSDVVFVNGYFYAYTTSSSAGAGYGNFYRSANGSTWTNHYTISFQIGWAEILPSGLVVLGRGDAAVTYYIQNIALTGSPAATVVQNATYQRGFSDGTSIVRAYNVQSTNPTTATVAGYAGAGYSRSGYNSNPYPVGGSFGGDFTPVVMASGYYITPTVDGYARGGLAVLTLQQPTSPGDGGSQSYAGSNGLVKVRWWA